MRVSPAASLLYLGAAAGACTWGVYDGSFDGGAFDASGSGGSSSNGGGGNTPPTSGSTSSGGGSGSGSGGQPLGSSAGSGSSTIRDGSARDGSGSGGSTSGGGFGGSSASGSSSGGVSSGACGRLTSDAGPSRVIGVTASVLDGGASLTAVDGVANVVHSATGVLTMTYSTSATLALTDFPNACAYAQASLTKANGRAVLVSLSMPTSTAGYPSLVGTYGGPPGEAGSASSGRTASVTFVGVGASSSDSGPAFCQTQSVSSMCQAVIQVGPDGAPPFTVSVTAADGVHVAGSFSGACRGTDTLAGTFDVPVCSGSSVGSTCCP